MIRIAQYPDDNQAILTMWREYIERTRTSLEFQQNEVEFTRFPEGYEAPHGIVLLAEVESEIAGCIAVRRHSAEICEMKRLYVHPYARGLGLGRRLVGEIVKQARRFGYHEMRLDVLQEFDHARRLYLDFGFTTAQPITNNPVPGTVFLGLKLMTTQ